MKALTLHPEWAHAIAHLGKRVENRTWKPPASMIGQRFAIHAGASIGGRPGRRNTATGLNALQAAVELARSPSIEWRMKGTGQAMVRLFDDEPSSRIVRTSAIICTAVLERVLHEDDLEEDRGALAWSAPGHWWWILSDVEVVNKPIPAKGRLGFWTVPA